MGSLFSPATALMNRLRYPQKFMALGALLCIVIILVLYSLYLSLGKVIDTAQNELDGLVITKQVVSTTRLIQQHRGLTVGTLLGLHKFTSSHLAKTSEVTTAIDTLKATLPLNIKNGPDWKDIEQQWGRLKAGESNFTALETYEAHTTLIDQLLIFVVSIADDYELTLDPEYGTYYLIDTAVNKLPQTLEFFAQVRGTGMFVLVNPSAGKQQLKALTSALGNLQFALNQFNANAVKIGRYVPDRQPSILAAAEHITQSSNQIVSMAESDILTKQFAKTPEMFFDEATSLIDVGYKEFF